MNQRWWVRHSTTWQVCNAVSCLSKLRGSPKVKLGEPANITNLNWGTNTKYLAEQENINHFRDQNAENKFGSNLGNKGTEANFYRNKGTRTP